MSIRIGVAGGQFYVALDGGQEGRKVSEEVERSAYVAEDGCPSLNGFGGYCEHGFRYHPEVK